jgi:transcriptional regulator with XRE-family HTH domain
VLTLDAYRVEDPMQTKTHRKRWPKGSWMKLTSANTLRALMEQKAFSRRRLARYCGLAGTGMIDHLLAGRRTSCTPKLAERIAEALDVPLGVLFVPAMSNAGGQKVSA